MKQALTAFQRLGLCLDRISRHSDLTYQQYSRGGTMIEVAVVSVLACVVAIAAYFERKSLKADVTAAEAKVLTVASKLLSERQEAFTVTRANVARVIADAKADAKRIEADVKAGVEEAKSNITVIVDKIEADIKKVL
jgi:hypothetical protein